MTLLQLKKKCRHQLAVYDKMYIVRRRALVRAQKALLRARARTKTPTVETVQLQGRVYDALFQPLINQYCGKMQI